MSMLDSDDEPWRRIPIDDPVDRRRQPDDLPEPEGRLLEVIEVVARRLDRLEAKLDRALKALED